MSYLELSDDEKVIVFEVLTASAKGPFFPDWEFHSLFGLNRNEVTAIVNSWEKIDKESENVNLAINNSFNNLIGYPHKKNELLPQYISASRDQLEIIFKKWRKGVF